MLTFPGCKINLGLYIERRRPDGYHDIATVMIPVGWTDILEAVPAPDNTLHLHTSGRTVDCPMDKNLVIKAYRALERHIADHGGQTLPPMHYYLQKIVPDGAGLGGGSADAAAAIVAANQVCDLGLTDAQMAAVAAQVGADCPFFIYNRPMLATGIGTDLQPVECNLSGLTLVVAKPAGCSVSTAQAYGGVKPSGEAPDIAAILQLPPEQWAEAGLRNDFEQSVIPLAPAIGRVKQQMLDAGAAYAAMSGSGAAVFGLFRTPPTLTLADCDVYTSVL